MQNELCGCTRSFEFLSVPIAYAQFPRGPIYVVWKIDNNNFQQEHIRMGSLSKSM